jgi:hypothetical protein
LIVLDENVVDDQRAQLRRWRIPFRQIGPDVGRYGMQDPEILPLLRTLHRPTLVSRDRDFSARSLCSDRYCLVYMDVRPGEVATYTRRLLRHSEFTTWAQRRGCVVRVTPGGITTWRLGDRRPMRYGWND